MNISEAVLQRETWTGKGPGTAHSVGAVVNSPETGRLVGTDEITDLQEAFCQAYVANGGIGNAAAKTVGYGDPRNASFKNLHLPKIRARIQEIVHERVGTRGAVIGYGVLVEIAQDTGAPPGVRHKCAVSLLEMAGFFRDKGQNTEGLRRKSLAEMTREELEQVVAHGASVLKAANVIGQTIEGHKAQDSAQAEAPKELSASSD